MPAEMKIDAVRIPDRSAFLDGDLHVPARCIGLVIFAHGSRRFSPRNRQVAAALESAGCATLMLDLLTREEEAVDLRTREYRFDIQRLARRVIASAGWASAHRPLREMNVGYFGASTGAAAVGGDDEPVIALNEQAKRRMRTIARLEIVPGATHLFEEHGSLEQVGSSDWRPTGSVSISRGGPRAEER